MACVILDETVKLRFGAFEIDEEAGELRRSGILVRLQPQPFKVLVRLARTPGELVTREELRALLWGDGTFVEFERGLNFAVSRVRDVLGDSARAPRFVETVPRRGYRFVAPVSRLEAPEPSPRRDAPPPPAPVPPALLSPRPRRPWLGAAAVLALLLAPVAVVARARRPAPAQADGVAARTAYESARSLCGADGWRRSVALYAEALRLDPGLAVAHAGMARSYLSLGEHGFLRPDQAFPAARQAADRALALEESAQARLLRGSARLAYDWDLAGAGHDLTRAVALAPRNAEAWARLARVRSAAGDDEGAVAAARRAEAIDPGDDAVAEELASCLWRARRLDESALVWRRLVERRGIASRHALFSILRRAGRGAEALEEARRAMEAAGVPADRIAAVERLGPEAGARAYLEGTIAFLTAAADPGEVPPDRLALLHAALGQDGRALDRLEEALAVRSPSLPLSLREPALDPLRAEPRLCRVLDAVSPRPSAGAGALVAFLHAAPPAWTR